MSNITNTTQLTLFSIIKGILKANSALSKFADGDYYEFDPASKSLSFNQFPYIVITIPESKTSLVSLNNKMTEKTLTVTIVVVNSFEAKDKVITYVNAIIDSLEEAETTFETSGYYNASVESLGSSPSVVGSKQVIQSAFTLTLEGSVIRT